MGVPQLQFGVRRDSHLLRDSESAHHLPPGALSPSPRLVPCSGSNGESFRARVAHGRAGTHLKNGLARFPPEKSEEREAARGVPSGSRQIRLEKASIYARPRFWHGRRVREAWKYCDVRGG